MICFGEIPSYSIENLMDRYLLDTGKITKDTVLNRRIQRARDIRVDVMTMLARMELVLLYTQTGKLDINIIREQFPDLYDTDIEWACKRVLIERRPIDYISRYIVADLVTTPYFDKMYEEDKKGVIKRLKQFCETMKEKGPEESLECLGLNLSYDTINSLLDQKREYSIKLDEANKKRTKELNGKSEFFK